MGRHSGQGAAPWEQKGVEITPFPEIPWQQVLRGGEGLEGKPSRVFLDCTRFHLGPGNLPVPVSGFPRRQSLGTSISSHESIQERPPQLAVWLSRLLRKSSEEDIQVGWSFPGVQTPSPAQNTQYNCISSIFPFAFFF